MSEKLYRLPKEFAEKWFELLLSGNYDQGKGYLINEEQEFCCLGVALHLCSESEELLGGSLKGEVGYLGDIEITIDEENLLEEIPEELLSYDSEEDLAFVLAELNDNGSIRGISKQPPEKEMVDILERYLIKQEYVELFKQLKGEPYSFEEIVEWVKENVELY